MGELAFAYQLAELEHISKLRTQQGNLNNENRRFNMDNNINKYTNYSYRNNNINNIAIMSNNNTNTSNNHNNSNSNSGKIRRINSSGESVMYNNNNNNANNNSNGNRRQRHFNQQQQQQQQNYYRTFDNTQFHSQLQQIQQLQQLEQLQPARPVSQPNPGLSSQFLDSLLVQQLNRNQTPSNIGHPQPQQQLNLQINSQPQIACQSLQFQPSTASSSFPFYEGTSTVSNNVTTPTSNLLPDYGSVFSSHSSGFDSQFSSLQSHGLFNDLPMYQQSSQSSQLSATQPSSSSLLQSSNYNTSVTPMNSTPGITNNSTVPSSSSSSSHFHPHQLMNLFFSDSAASLPQTSNSTPVIGQGSILRSTADNSSKSVNTVINSELNNGLVDPLESIWKRDSSSNTSNNSTIGLNSKSQVEEKSIGSYF